ncbi:hypothetical protein APHAL10511_003824 [Amanita phalloides]|nr:hypothetical protein APHAL10511_003824 [Amanita phalloides]
MANPPLVLKTQVKLQNQEVALQAAFSMAFNLAITVPLKQEEKYPLVMFWLHNKYKKQKRSTGSHYCFLQNSDGKEIAEAQLNKIHAFLLGMFNELKEFLADNSALPQTWANATNGHAIINACHSELCQ